MHGIEIPVAVVGTQGFDPNFHVAIIKLAISYTLALAFVFTVAVTLMSMLGWVKFADPKQQKRLFVAVVVQLSVGCVGVFFDFLKINPSEVREEIQAPLVVKVDEAELARDRAKAELAATEAALATTREEQVQLNAALQESKGLLDARTSELQRLNEEVTDISVALNAAQQAKTRLESDLVASKAELAGLEELKRETAAKLAEIQRALADAEAQLASESSRANDLQKTVNFQAQELATVKVKYSDAIKEIPVSRRSRFLATREGG